MNLVMAVHESGWERALRLWYAIAMLQSHLIIEEIRLGLCL